LTETQTSETNFAMVQNIGVIIKVIKPNTTSVVTSL